MKQLIKFGFIVGLTISSPVFSADPVQGLYVGVLAGISHASNPQLNFSVDQASYNPTITLGPVGGGGGFSLGYKVNRFRLEGEFLFNINNYSEAKLGSCTLISPTVLGPQGTCPDFIEDNGLGFKGNTTGLYGLFNVFFDFLSTDTNVNFVPYVGFGVGGAMIRNKIQIQNNQYFDSGATPISLETTVSKNGIAGQGIIGFSYYLDDFATIGMDFRYLTTVKSNSSNNTISSNSNSQFGVATINFTGNFALDKSK